MISAFTMAATLALAAVLPTHGAQFNVTVGGGALKFNPEFVDAAVGDTILFSFRAKNHTATQSSFANPCTQVESGFDTGFVPVSIDDTDGPFPAAALTVTDKNPIWVFCAQAGHCAAGMVFAVNPGEKFNAFKDAATGTLASSSSSAASSSSTATSSSYGLASGLGSSASSTSSVTVTASSPAASSSATSASITVSTTSSTPASSTTTSTTSSSSTFSFVPPPMTASVSRPAPTQTSISSDHHVIVGGGALTFSPSNITAEIGDTITFEFRSGNHSATASTFGSPCSPLAASSPGNVAAFDSGFMPVASGASAFPTFTIQINNSMPVWAFCKQANHCGKGMVFSVNAKAEAANNFQAFLANAEKQNGTASNAGSNVEKSATGRVWSSGAGAVYLALTTFGVVLCL